MRQVIDSDRGIIELMKECFEIAESKGWHNYGPITFSEAIALMHSELSEALEEYRDGRGPNEIYYKEDSKKPLGLSIELADLAIRLFHYSRYFQIDLVNAILTKLEYNKTRPYRHGDKII